MGSLDRRQVLRLGVLGLTLVGTSVGVGQLADAGPAAADDEVEFLERYKARQIRGVRGPRPRVFIDGVELHLMRVGPHGFTSPLNHYQTFRTPRRAAWAAVDSLNGARLLPFHR